MALTFDYRCFSCGDMKTNHELESFACPCGGDFKMVDRGSIEKIPYDFHYDETLKRYVSSWAEAEKFGKEYKTENHPEGLYLWERDARKMREYRHMHKHKEELHQEIYAKDGIKYKPGSNTKWSEKYKEFVPAHNDPHSPTRKRTYSFGS